MTPAGRPAAFRMSNGIIQAKQFVVTLKTGDHKWSSVMVEADTHFGAARVAKRLLGDYPVAKIV